MSLAEYEARLNTHESHIEDVLRDVLAIIREGLKPGGTLKPSRIILDALFISQAHKGYSKMEPEMRRAFEKGLLRRLHEGKHAGIRCATALELAILYAAMSDVGERPALEEEA